MTLAYFITYTTYGTRLHGDSKGTVDREHNVYGTPILEEDPDRERGLRAAMKQPAYVMTLAEAEIVCQAIVGIAVERGWYLHAVHVRTNHVHIVISTDRDPQRLMSDLKGRSSRDLTRASFDDAERRRWTRGGSTRHLFTEENIADAVRYALDEQGEPMACYSCDRNKKEVALEPRTQ